MNAYPLELRQRILDAVERGVGSAPRVARLFCVAVHTVSNLQQLRAQTGALQPRPNPGGRPPAIPPQRHDEIRQLRAAQPDLTLAQIRDRLGLDCSEAAVCRTLKKLGLTRKKKRCAPPSSDGPMSRRTGRSGSSGRPS
jgi:transposase